MADGLPIIAPGDILEKWDSPPELINFLIRELDGVPVYAVAGNHDLPFHNYKELKRSAYWTLCESRILLDISGRELCWGIRNSKIRARLKGWACDKLPSERAMENKLKDTGAKTVDIAVVHDYAYDPAGEHHPNAKPEQTSQRQCQKLRSYDFAVFGDNHKRLFDFQHGVRLINCGTFLRRRSDERGNEPCVVVLYSDGTFERHDLDTSKDKWREDVPEVKLDGIDPEKLMAALRGLTDISLNFADSVRAYVRTNKVPREIRLALIDLLKRCEGA